MAAEDIVQWFCDAEGVNDDGICCKVVAAECTQRSGTLLRERQLLTAPLCVKQRCKSLLATNEVFMVDE